MSVGREKHTASIHLPGSRIRTKAVDKTAVEQSASSSAGAGKQGASKAPLSQRKAVQRQNLEEARAYVMVYDQVQKKLVMNGTSDRFVHDIWGGAAGS